jgi:hypothetical protein
MSGLRSPYASDEQEEEAEPWYHFYRRPNFQYYWGGVTSWVLRPFVQVGVYRRLRTVRTDTRLIESNV